MPRRSILSKALACAALATVVACGAGKPHVGIQLEPGTALARADSYVVLPVVASNTPFAVMADGEQRMTISLRQQLVAEGLRVASDTAREPGAIRVRGTLLSYPSASLSRCVLRVALHAPDGRLLAELLATEDATGTTYRAVDKCAYSIANAVRKHAERR